MDQKKPPEIQINASPEDMKGRFANGVFVSIQDREIVIDFVCGVSNGSSVSQSLVSRIFMHHELANSLIGLLRTKINEWQEAKYGVPTNSPNDSPPQSSK